MSDDASLELLARQLFTDGVAAQVISRIKTGPAPQTATVRLPSTQAAGASIQSLWTLGRGDRFYDSLSVGRFQGTIELTWNGIDKDGIDSFLYTPSPRTPFSYTDSAGRTVAPQQMLTDGGSIPSLLRGVNQFTPWRYAPAYIVHDWLFVAKKCGIALDHNWTFEETADIMAEAMKTMTEQGFPNARGGVSKLPKNADVVYLVHLAVSSGIARRVWNDNSTVTCLTGANLPAARSSAEAVTPKVKKGTPKAAKSKKSRP